MAQIDTDKLLPLLALTSPEVAALVKELVAERDAFREQITEWEIAADEGYGDCMIGVAITPDWLRARRREEGSPSVRWSGPLRLVLMDVPGQPLALAVHDQAGERVAVAVKPMDALALAVDLTSSARRRLAGGAS